MLFTGILPPPARPEFIFYFLSEDFMKHRLPLCAALAATAIFAGCASEPQYSNYPTQSQYPSQQYPSQQYPSQYPPQYPPQYQSQPASYTVGTVDRIEVVRKGDPNNVAGTVIGGIIGGLIGHQIGGGSGQTAATVVGAVGGAVAGNQVQNRQRGANETFRVTVRMDDGRYQTVTEENITDLRPGDRVRLEGGRLYRA
jgi:outer membrane lipoprotein SlyB